jgi:phosphatidylinositol 3-kinase
MYSKLRTGMHDLRLWSDVEADGSDASHTLGKLGSNTAVSVSAAETSGTSRANEQLMANLAKLTKRHRLGQMAQLDWLDRLTFREIELINEKEKRQSNFMYLMVEFPKITWQGASVNVVYNEPVSINSNFSKFL